MGGVPATIEPLIVDRSFILGLRAAKRVIRKAHGFSRRSKAKNKRNCLRKSIRAIDALLWEARFGRPKPERFDAKVKSGGGDG